eukprot:TRINITY_DN23598_c0_g2_i1.p1 TRINITY_DN23598_c0_g2~~TRINITY_DN23598_c0_g2_i1.p1  ORF type:complete len:361 (+),score=68.82 TRINITY_DN23598_c0_g2_i1:80-1084(+)
MAAPAPDDLLAGDCRICLGEGWHSPAPRAADAAARPAAGGPQCALRQRAPSVGPPRAAPGAGARPAADRPSDEVAADTAAELIAPCLCRGTSKYWHKECLLRWLRDAAALSLPLHCGACLTAYRTVNQRRGLLTSPAPVAVEFREFVIFYWALAAAAFAAEYINPSWRIGFSSTAAFLVQNRFCVFLRMMLAVLLVLLNQIDPDLLPTRDVPVENTTAPDTPLATAGSHLDHPLVPWMIAASMFLVAGTVSFLVTRRADGLQSVLQTIMTGNLLLLIEPHPLHQTGLLISALCTLANAFALWVDIRAHEAEHAGPIIDVLEPPAAHPHGADYTG